MPVTRTPPLTSGLADLADESVAVTLTGRQIEALWRVLAPASAAAAMSPTDRTEELAALASIAAALLVAYGVRRHGPLSQTQPPDVRTGTGTGEGGGSWEQVPSVAVRPVQSGTPALDGGVGRVHETGPEAGAIETRALARVEALLERWAEYEADQRVAPERRRGVTEPRISAASLRALAAQLRGILAGLGDDLGDERLEDE
ncbi:MAG TPA: hypothetical protein VFX49_11470 [Chloroflexota bacterium]|nr:hypothetical protein [Chloroflexota bacterium]